jgi:hypothetical protein
MSTSNSMRRSTRIRRAPVRFNPCLTKSCCSHHDKHTEKKELLPPPALPVLDLTDTCCICMEDVDTKKNRVTTECGHTFCSSCLFRHLEENHQCPLCRFALRRPVKKTPILSPPVAESLITSLSNSEEERVQTEIIAREIYFQVREELEPENRENREDAWSRASIAFRSRIRQLMRGHQIMWGYHVCREISQWMQYVSTNPTGLPNLTSLNLEIQDPDQLRENITNVDEFIENSGEGEGPDNNDYVSDADTEINEAAIGLEVDNMNDLSDYINDDENEMDSDSDMPGLEDIPMADLEPIPPIPLESSPAELSDSDRDVINYIFEFNRNEPIMNHIEGQIINNIGIDRIISDAMNMINNHVHYRQNRR